jgi:hypothetical protein
MAAPPPNSATAQQPSAKASVRHYYVAVGSPDDKLVRAL